MRVNPLRRLQIPASRRAVPVGVPIVHGWTGVGRSFESVPREPNMQHQEPVPGPCGPARVTVVGLGNVLMCDDAVGPYVIRVLGTAYALCGRLRLLDAAAVSGGDLAARLAETDVLIMIGAVEADGAPGEVKLYRREQIEATLGRVPGAPGHALFGGPLLPLLRRDASAGEILLIGVIPLEMHAGAGLSAPVRRSVPQVIREIVRELARVGHTPVLRVGAPPADIWWEGPIHATL
jgi:hydrogenase maturation protease